MSSLADLTSSQRTKVSQVMEVAPVGVKEAIRVLKEHDWNVNVTIEYLLDYSGSDREDATPQDWTKIDAWFDSLSDEQDLIEANGIIKLAGELDIDPESDPVILIIAQAMEAKHMMQFTREEFRRGMAVLKCSSSKELKEELPSLRATLSEKAKFKSLYQFLYSYSLEIGQKVMSKAMGIALWKLLFANRFALIDEWTDFFEKNSKHGVSKDLWSQFYIFAELSGIQQRDFTAFDAIESWPILLDDFVAHLKSGK